MTYDFVSVALLCGISFLIGCILTSIVFLFLLKQLEKDIKKILDKYDCVER